MELMLSCKCKPEFDRHARRNRAVSFLVDGDESVHFSCRHREKWHFSKRFSHPCRGKLAFFSDDKSPMTGALVVMVIGTK